MITYELSVNKEWMNESVNEHNTGAKFTRLRDKLEPRTQDKKEVAGTKKCPL